MSTRTITIPLQSTQTGLTLAAQLVDSTGTNSGAAVTTGFVELGNGHYLWTYASFPTQFRGAVKFTSAGVVVASLAVNPEEAENVDATVSSRLAISGYTAPPSDYQQRGVAVTLPSPAPAGYGVSGTVDANLVSILNDTVSVQNFKADELAAAPTIPTAAQNAAAVWDLITTGHETTGSFGALVAAGGSGGTIDYAAMETYFAAHGGLSANAIAIAGSAPAGINLRDDELATAPTLPAVDSLGRVTVGTVADKVGYSLNLAQSGLAPRALDSVADSALTLGDALVAAIAGAAGKESISGSSYLIRTPFTGTPIRSFTLDSPTNPTSRT